MTTAEQFAGDPERGGEVMTELEQIAASVAKALGLILSSPDMRRRCYFDARHGSETSILEKDGSNLFDPYWQVRCRDWLLERGFNEWSIRLEGGCVANFARSSIIRLECPAAEFAARAIHQLVTSPTALPAAAP